MVIKKSAFRKRQENKGILPKLWDFLWNSNSIWSWIADLALLYVIVRFIFFPTLGFFLGTPLPSVIIQSGSMTHQGNFDEWWQDFGTWYLQNNITKEQVTDWPYRNGLDIGDIIILKGVRDKNYVMVGEVIVFDANQLLPIIHRVVMNSSKISTKGDNNMAQLEVEKLITQDRIIGKAIFRIPKLGWFKLAPVRLLKEIFS